MRLIDREKEKILIGNILSKGYDSLSLLFEGKDCSGKKLTALYTARGLVCEKNQLFGCGECQDCKLVNNIINENKELPYHPNIKIISSENQIKIDQIREINDFFALKDNKWKVVIIEDAQKMNTEASNALLKTLEEPPEKTAIILTTSSQNLLLPTIVSRCKKIRFSPLDIDNIKQILEQRNIKPNEIILNIAKENLCLAFKVAGKEEILRYSKDLVNLIQDKIHIEGIITLAEILDKLDEEDLKDVINIFEILVYNLFSENKIDIKEYENILKELKILKLSMEKGVKKKLALEGFYLNLKAR